MSGSFTINMGDGVSHSAALACTNADSTPANDVDISYHSDNEAVCIVNGVGGNLVPQAAGTCNITGTGFRNGVTHTDSVALTVANEDFSVVLTLK